MNSFKLINKKFKTNVKENAAALGEEGMRNESKFFYEMLMITYSSKKEQYEQLKNRYKLMLENNEAEMWNNFEKKIDMLIEELNCFIEIVDDLNHIQEIYEKNKAHRDSIKQKLSDLINSDVDMVGFFSRKPKKEKIEKYREEVNKTDALDNAYKKVLNLVSALIINNEIDTIKSRKKMRYDDALKTYSESKIKSLEDCLQFWHCVHDDFESTDIMQSRFGNYQPE